MLFTNKNNFKKECEALINQYPNIKDLIENEYELAIEEMEESGKDFFSVVETAESNISEAIDNYQVIIPQDTTAIDFERSVLDEIMRRQLFLSPPNTVKDLENNPWIDLAEVAKFVGRSMEDGGVNGALKTLSEFDVTVGELNEGTWPKFLSLMVDKITNECVNEQEIDLGGLKSIAVIYISCGKITLNNDQSPNPEARSSEFNRENIDRLGIKTKKSMNGFILQTSFDKDDENVSRLIGLTRVAENQKKTSNKAKKTQSMNIK